MTDGRPSRKRHSKYDSLDTKGLFQTSKSGGYVRERKEVKFTRSQSPSPEELRPSAEKSTPVESPLGARHRELRRAAPPAQRNDANSPFNKRLHISSKNNGAANISTETKYQNLRQADKDTRAVSSYRHELSKTDPPVRIWYQVDTAVGKMSIRTQVNESEVPDGAIWFADWEVMANEDKAQFGHNYQQYREMKRRQKALRRGELENV